MSKDNLWIWNNVKQVPPACTKKISGGRLNGMTDIKPQWRLQQMTHQFGPCGIGWKFEYVNKWIEDGSDGQRVAFVDINLFYKIDNKWSDPIPGTGGASFIAKEKAGLYTSDEAYKMATTDALSVAMKMIGLAADIYMGAFDGSKYHNTDALTYGPGERNKKPELSIDSPSWKHAITAYKRDGNFNAIEEKMIVSNETKQLIIEAANGMD